MAISCGNNNSHQENMAWACNAEKRHLFVHFHAFLRSVSIKVEYMHETICQLSSWLVSGFFFIALLKVFVVRLFGIR